MIIFSVFVLYPMITAFSYAFFDWQGTARGAFSGVENFFTLFTAEPFKSDLPRALMHNLLLFAGAMVFQNTVGLAIAAFLYKRRRFKKLFQTLYTLPYLVSPLVIGYLWTLLLSPLFGPVNALLKAIGLGELAQPWLGQPSTALWVIVLVTAWQWLGFPILLYGAALGGIPEELTEAASLDGATAWQTLPLDHAAAADLGDRHRQHPDLHRVHGGAGAAVRHGRVHRFTGRSHRRPVADVLPDRL